MEYIDIVLYYIIVIICQSELWTSVLCIHRENEQRLALTRRPDLNDEKEFQKLVINETLPLDEGWASFPNLLGGLAIFLWQLERWNYCRCIPIRVRRLRRRFTLVCSRI